MDIIEIDAEIERLEGADANYDTCTRLAILYSIKDHQKGRPVSAESSYAGSEFLMAATSAPYDQVLSVLDEHLECIKALYPKEYKAIINRIKQTN